MRWASTTCRDPTPMIEWTAAAVILDARMHGEADALISIMTEEHGAHRGLARGGGGRRQAALWQQGNLVQARWTARLPDQLGTLTAEPVRAGAAAVMDDALRLQVLAAACAVADGALPEREPHPIVFGALSASSTGCSTTRLLWKPWSTGKPPCSRNSATASTSAAAP